MEKVEVGESGGLHIIPLAWKEEMKSREMQRQKKINPNVGMMPNENVP